MTTKPYDAILIGAGHNGLVCATYLAKAGLKVLVLERRGVVGGAAVTEEFHPGFRNSVASYTVSLLNPKIIRDLDLHGHGLRIVERRMSNFLTIDDRAICFDGDWSKLWWVRADGTGRVLEPGTAEAEHAITLLAERYPQQRAVGAVLAIDVARWSGWSSR